MKRVVCKSGLRGWRCRLRENYASMNEWRHYSAMYGLAERLGFTSAESAWAANPVIEGSVEPSDFRMVKNRLWKEMTMKRENRIRALQRQGFEINREIVFSTAHLSQACAKALGTASRNEQGDSLSGLCVYLHDEYGFRIFVPDNERFDTEFSELDRILRFAQDNKIDWILFDCDGPMYKQFPSFDW